MTVVDYESIDYSSYWRTNPERIALDLLENSILRKFTEGITKGNWAIDLGGGYGRLTARYFPCAENVVLFDYSKKLLVEAKQKYMNLENKPVYVLGDVNRLPFRDNVFSLSAMIRVIHHLPDPEKPLNEVRRTLKDNSRFLFTYYNKRKLSSILRFLLGRQEYSPFTVDHQNIDDHYYCTHPGYIDDLLERKSFKKEKEYNVGLPFEVFGHMRVYPVGLERMLMGVMNPLKLSQFVYSRWVLKEADISDDCSDSKDIRDIFACPECRNTKLECEETTIKCDQCSNSYEIRDGIYDFRTGTVSKDD